ncbi:PhzF family isomerase [uncultured Shimia sp.]|uniref:PhzF family isomerase n=1 Tax=uncultured Shimia sp. TaxID=573152 RepID=UPI0025F8A476|nr:PhzF family isomerase [uncultured Shimia sp.]
MSSVEVFVIDAFTRTPNSGNRAGVVLDAAGLDSQQMQAIAAFAGYSETAFVLPADARDHDVHVRYFTPTREVPICGHATIATHFLRAVRGHAGQYPMVAKTGAGLLPVELSQLHGDGALRVSMTQGVPEFMTPFGAIEQNRLVKALGIMSDDLMDLPVQIVSTGHSKVIIPLRERKVLDGLKPDMPQLAALSGDIGCNGFFPFVLEGSRANPVTYGRMFAPAIGIDEDPVTGNANGPTGAYLVHHDLIDCDRSCTYPGHQGVALGLPGTVYVTVSREGGKLKVQIAGEAVEVGTRMYSF